MRPARQQLSISDLRFIAVTLIPERPDLDHVIGLLREDADLLDAMLQDDRLFRELMAADEEFLLASPELFFKVLLMRSRREFQAALYGLQRRQGQRAAWCDAARAVDLLGRPEVCDYLAGLLASFTHRHQQTVPVRLPSGAWHRLRIHDLDIDTMMRYVQVLEEPRRFAGYRRVADACLFLAGMCPEAIGSSLRYPRSRPRPRLCGSLLYNLEDVEAFGRTYYHLAATRPEARQSGLDGVLSALSEQFVLAEKPLNFLAERHLSLRKQVLFETLDWGKE
jgi:hypothetical protein